MTNYSLRARMMILILAPTVLIGLLLSIFFVVHRYNDLHHTCFRRNRCGYRNDPTGTCQQELRTGL